MDYPPPIPPLQQVDTKLAVADPPRSPIDQKPILRNGIAYQTAADSRYDYAQDFEAYFAANRRQVAEEIDNLNRKRAELGGLNNHHAMVQPLPLYQPAPVYQPPLAYQPAAGYYPAPVNHAAPILNPAPMLRPLVVGELVSRQGIRRYSVWARPGVTYRVLVNIINFQVGMPFMGFRILSRRFSLELLRHFLDVASTGTQDFLLRHMNLSPNRFDIVIATAKHWDKLRLAAVFL